MTAISLNPTSAWRGVAVVAVVLSSLSLARGWAPDPPPQSLNETQRDEVAAVVRQLVSTDPNLVVDALRLAQTRIAEQRNQHALSLVRAQASNLYEDATAPAVGAADPAVTIVEFLDYQCGFCRRAHPELERLLADNPDVRLVTKQIPILGPASLFAARAVMAADRLGQFPAFHDALMESRARLNEDIVMHLAQRSGIDTAALAAEMAAAEGDTQSALARNTELARALGVTGTPAFVVGDQVLRGLPDFATLRQLVDAERRESS